MNFDLVVKEFLPGWGFFGSGDALALTISIDKPIKKLTIGIVSESDTFLNLRGVDLLDDKGMVLSQQKNCEVIPSSLIEGSDPYRLLQRAGFHSKAEREPCVDICFPHETYVSKVVIYNRGDRWGERSRTLRIKSERDDGTSFTAFDYTSTAYLSAVARKVLKMVGCENFDPLIFCDEMFDLSTFRRAYVVPVLLSKLRKNKIKTVDWISVFQVLDIWGQATQDEVEIISFYFNEMINKKSFNLSEIKQLEKVFSTKESIFSLEETINSVRKFHGFEELMLTKHGFAKAGKLVKDKEKVLKNLETVISILEDIGREPVLAYGTLLGAVRENAFIQHDDDVDLLVKVNASNREQAVLEIEKICSLLAQKGYRIGPDVSNMNRHVINNKSGSVVDLFPYWEVGRECFLHMEKMKVRPIPSGIMNGRKMLRIYEYEFPSPINSEGFLNERYGEGWRFPDRFHEWPWELKG